MDKAITGIEYLPGQSHIAMYGSTNSAWLVQTNRAGTRRIPLTMPSHASQRAKAPVACEANPEARAKLPRRAGRWRSRRCRRPRHSRQGGVDHVTAVGDRRSAGVDQAEGHEEHPDISATGEHHGGSRSARGSTRLRPTADHRNTSRLTAKRANAGCSQTPSASRK